MDAATDAMAEARRHIETALVEKAASNAGFRDLLKNDPHGALKEQFGTDPIPSLKISVVEERAGEIVLVLPRAIAEDELPDALLDYAAGGNAQECWNSFKKDFLFKPLEGKGLV
ncbi:NHLP leader peptide family natural product precursor [Rhizobium sp. RU36D]|uniref:NHLP leader peptide family natural product precursor n=1 Tax=Rhizobium sp. RU36D TaxID=1907415 RepID=UPI0009D7EA9C|nr:NHLP leader peptide family natural product precursor [Rhizobium sp. RU36D]SMD17848.1 hypothetical protein SAMN05880593_13334 [Rhizobium sp. RU36D]